MAKPRDGWTWWERNGHWVALAIIAAVTAGTFTICVILGSTSILSFGLYWLAGVIGVVVIAAYSQL